MKITMTVKAEAIASTIITAVEQGIHYWARNVGHDEKVTPTAEKMAAEHKLPGWSFAPLTTGFVTVDEYDETVAIGYDEDGNEDPDVGLVKRHTLDYKAIQRGLNVLASSKHEGHQKLLGEVLSGYADCQAADVFIQMCLFGEVVYG